MSTIGRLPLSASALAISGSSGSATPAAPDFSILDLVVTEVEEPSGVEATERPKGDSLSLFAIEIRDKVHGSGLVSTFRRERGWPHQTE